MDIEGLKLGRITHKQPHQYLRGPIPLVWLSRAACIPGRVLHVALALWHISKLRRSRTVKMQSRILLVFGISREVYYKSLERLEETGLVSVEKRPGSTPTVTILDAINEG